MARHKIVAGDVICSECGTEYGVECISTAEKSSGAVVQRIALSGWQQAQLVCCVIIVFIGCAVLLGAGLGIW